MLTVVVFIFILAVLVLVHEFGHFIAAKKQGVLVEEFGFGYPPRIFGFQIGETLYSLNLIPLGGFVKLYGEASEELANQKKSVPKNRAFINKKPWQKALIIVAGVLGNFLLGWLLIAYLFTQGVPSPTKQVIVEAVQKNSPAARAGIIPKDIIEKIIVEKKQYEIKSTADLINLSKKFAGQSLTFQVLRDGQKKFFEIVPRKNPPAGQGPLGVVITNFVEKKYPWYQAPFYGLIEAFAITKQILVELLKTLFLFLTLQKPKTDLSGPIGVAYFTGQVIKFGKNAVLELIALLSLNLAVINIFLPFPLLDGGRLVLIIYEWITRKKVNKTLEKYLNIIGLAFLITIAILVSVNDIIKIYR
ncbi:MAG: M50 family metallopeptidase [Microgenomates group bacterium]|nr:M50 family metallopeptidase [Microgenomates group bacterium]